MIILLLAVLVLFTAWRACSRSGLTAGISTHLGSRMPSGGAGAVAVATMSADKAPQHVRMMISYLQRVKHFRPLKGFKGGRVFRNREGLLPPGKTYYEFDVRPFTSQAARGQERLVIDASKEAFYYTRDHYATFIRIIE